MAAEVDWGKRYSMAIPYLALVYRAWGIFVQVLRFSRSYGPWPLVLGWLGMYFPQGHSKYTPHTHFDPSFISYMATFLKVMCKSLSHLFDTWIGSHFEPIIVDDVSICQQDFTYLVASCPNVLIYRNKQHIHGEVYHFLLL